MVTFVLSRLLLLLLLLRHADAANGKCHALALSGGGNRGAYMAGVIQRLVDSLPAQEAEWDVVTGISVGAILTSYMGLYAVGDEVSMAHGLVNTTLSLSQTDIFRDWPIGGLVSGFLFEKGLFDASPLNKTLHRLLGNPPLMRGRKIVVGATSLTTGQLETWTEAHTKEPWPNDLITGVLASAGFPPFLDAVASRGQMFSDGGGVMPINIWDAVQRCREMGFKDRNIVLDMVATVGRNQTIRKVDTDQYHTTDVYGRYSDIQSIRSSTDSIVDAKLAMPDVNFRLFYGT